ncbi:MAG: peptidase M49 [Acidobacteria bacterium]|nr:MAG: peptidase M49 [Acidobacteriota bacterium]
MTEQTTPAPPTTASPAHRKYLLERVDDAAVVQLYADGFGDLPLREKMLTWHLTQAAIAGRDIFYDQRYAHNLVMREVLEAIVTHPADIDRATVDEILRYTKLFWINTGPYNNLTARKFVLSCSQPAFAAAAHAAERAGATFPLGPGDTLDDCLARLAPMFFDADFDPTVTSKTPPQGKDILSASANNLYAGVTVADLERFEETYPLNSRVVKRDGHMMEEVYRVDGLYGRHIAAIVDHLQAGIPFADAPTARALNALVRFYRTGDDTDREAYDIAWVADKSSSVDTINGFVEVYLDARGVKGAWEALVWYVNREKTFQIRTIAEHAQWFEDRMPWDPRFRKHAAHGVTAYAIDVVIETGESGPITPVGINLPNDQTIRERYGSRSVSLTNVNEAYDKSTLPEFRREFSWTPEEAERAAKWNAFAGELTTNMHEVIGHGSGRIEERLQGNPQAALREQYSALEESRADLVALYFLPDPKLVELGLVADEDHAEIVRAEYEGYTRNALVQLRRVRQGTHIEEDHMRNRQMVVHWLIAHTAAIDVRGRDGKTYYVMIDPHAFREGVGHLLGEVQRIKAEGDYEAARALFETYGIHFDPALRDEVVARVDRLRLPSYTAFVMPKLEASMDDSGAIFDVTISYPLDLAAQMLEYSASTRHLRS